MPAYPSHGQSFRGACGGTYLFMSGYIQMMCACIYACDYSCDSVYWLFWYGSRQCACLQVRTHGGCDLMFSGMAPWCWCFHEHIKFTMKPAPHRTCGAARMTVCACMCKTIVCMCSACASASTLPCLWTFALNHTCLQSQQNACTSVLMHSCIRVCML